MQRQPPAKFLSRSVLVAKGLQLQQIVTNCNRLQLLDVRHRRFVFALTAVFPVLVSCSSLLVTEQPVARRSRAPGHTSHTFTAASHTLSATSSSTRYVPVASSDDAATKPLLTNGAISSSLASATQHELRGATSSSNPGPNGHPSVDSTAHPSGLAGAASVRAAGGVESDRQASPSHPGWPSRLPTSTAAVSPSSLERGLRGAASPPSSSPSSPSPSSVLCSSPECPPGGAWDGHAPLAVRLGRQARSLWGALSQRHILLPMAFIFLWQATPTANTGAHIAPGPRPLKD